MAVSPTAEQAVGRGEKIGRGEQACVVQTTANTRQRLADGSSSWCPKLESRTTQRCSGLGWLSAILSKTAAPPGLRASRAGWLGVVLSERASPPGPTVDSRPVGSHLRWFEWYTLRNRRDDALPSNLPTCHLFVLVYAVPDHAPRSETVVAALPTARIEPPSPRCPSQPASPTSITSITSRSSPPRARAWATTTITTTTTTTTTATITTTAAPRPGLTPGDSSDGGGGRTSGVRAHICTGD